MSKILEKPFSWANKIIRAVFKGSPNLITTSDLNRQIEALKKEMFVIRQANRTIISDLSAHSGVSGTFSALFINCSYIFCEGVRFDFEQENMIFRFGPISKPVSVNKELRLYAKKMLITSDDDFSKEISGVKFEDGTTRPAANHFVYEEPELVLVDTEAPNLEFGYAEYEGKEYICTLLRVVKTTESPEKGEYPVKSYIQKFTTPLVPNDSVSTEVYGKFDQFKFARKDLLDSLNPNAQDTWKTAVHKLWSRMYTLEKRLFMDSLLNQVDIPVAGSAEASFTQNRSYEGYFVSPKYGNTELKYTFFISGCVCLVSGYLKIGKVPSTDYGKVDFDLTTDGHKLPQAVPTEYGDWYFNVMKNSGIPYGDPEISAFIRKSTLSFREFPDTGGSIYWSGTYFIDTNELWTPSVEDGDGVVNV